MKNEIKKYSYYYNDLVELRLAISALPVIGSQLDYIFSSPGQKFAEERVQFMIEELQSQLNDIEEHLINKEILKSEEGYDLFQKSFIIATKTRQKEKLKVFAKILRGSITQNLDDHDPELYLKIIDELSEREIEVAFLIFDVKERRNLKVKGENEAQDGMTNDAYWFSKNYTNFSKDELEFILPRIERTGLLKELVGSFIGYGGGLYNVTPLFHRFIEFIENNRQ